MTQLPIYQYLNTQGNEIVYVTLNRPEVRNAFNEGLIGELQDVFTNLGADDDCRVIVLQANGKSFCAGADLNWMKSMANFTKAENIADSRKMALMLNTIYSCPKPVIAKVQGDAYAGGVGLASVCDVLIASTQVRFCISEAKLGLLPATIAPYVIRALGEQASRRYFVTAEVFTAAHGKEIGFVHELVDPDALDSKVDEICQAILSNGPMAVMACKKMVRDISQQAITPALLEDTVERIATIRTSNEAQVRMKAFLEKSK
ncbi:enoyl-CoA hydratase/isomerase family protein [Polynucleobacter sp. AP-Melu-500A-A1]|uniref:enoyl-CoA hydratase/isomerase family protein n=1 Tax=Polynucleobacter sp. AP-Melu-500A-A1 TaxID=2576929 RepID=UPI001C0C76CF|nr:enoyl-CoA hydratase/isomerase family protein [Polynucleobacter sp. AP-Melu-500A-A1]MBU3631224.1 enoyl-CoA hydratase/isomerase family protein [Polynucleobacter sp. AP-Melu-500A-A1]